MLPTTHPSVFEEFTQGNSVVRETANQFSAMRMDQAHERQNELIERVSGDIGNIWGQSLIASPV